MGGSSGVGDRGWMYEGERRKWSCSEGGVKIGGRMCTKRKTWNRNQFLETKNN